MEPMQSPSEVHSGEDFVHMEDSKPTGVMSLSDSIVNVEKADLLDKAVEEEEGNKVSDSVVSGGNGADVGECSPETRRVDLPEDLTKSLVILTCESIGNNGSCDVYLIGTDHASKESCRQVQAIISILKPEVVFLELCCRRMSALQSQTVKISIKDVDVYGDEFRVAYEEALKYGGKVVLGDRHQEITFKRTWAKMPLWLKVKCIYFTLFVAFFLPSAQVDGKINGPWWPVPLGRRDGRISRKSEVNLPSPLAGIAALKKKFFDKGLNTKDLVVLSGAHTIGISHCSVIHQGIYNFTGKADSDSSMNPRYVRALKRRCNPADNRTIVMDPRSVKKFDSHYFNMVAQRKGLFKSDRTLLDDPETKSYIYTQVATAGSSFNKDFAHSMVKLGFVEILTGNKGEIRKRCAFVN
ncbi:unnamed protein product [Brassica napus]|uniref:Peroxidase n=1 Tax=Brassica napus TaxID=3708 RepID=A0A816KDV4_BRANA|nr:unnamed protein product [Brassica napus]